MGEIKETKLQHIMKLSWESEQMPGWEDSLSMILETTKKEFQIQSKGETQKNIDNKALKTDEYVLEEEFTM